MKIFRPVSGMIVMDCRYRNKCGAVRYSQYILMDFVEIYCFRYLSHVIDSNPHIYFLSHTLQLLGNFPAYYFLQHNSLQIMQIACFVCSEATAQF